MNYHGINIPLSSLHSKKSCGTGEFYDLVPLIDWCSQVGFNIIQLLPINDTGYDTSPYNALTSMALHPIYISLHALEHLNDHPQLKRKLVPLRKFNKSQRVQYTKVYEAKVGFLRAYYEAILKKLDKDEEFIKFKVKHAELKKYALFKILKEKHALASWQDWPHDIRDPTPQVYRTQFKKYEDEINFHLFMQLIAYKQMLTVKRHAHKKDVEIMGDIPILISPESADVWAYRNYFNINLAAGAPPDDFNKDGQYWGFPLYKWSVLKKDNYKWWKQRLQYAQHFYDVFRIDHVIGFYRIWGIPLEQLATKGKYYPESERAFARQGHSILRALLKFTNMHPIGEDLGSQPFTPPPITRSLHNLGIDRMIVVRWETYYSNGKFIPYEKYPEGSMTSVSTHDTETLEQWWIEYPKEAKKFAKFRKMTYKKKLTKEMRLQILQEVHALPSCFHVNLLQEYLPLHRDLVWGSPDDERINRPGIMAPTNWTYRYKPSVEEIAKHTPLKNSVKKILS